MTSFGKILKSTFVSIDPFEKYLNIKGVDVLSFDEKIGLLKIIQNGFEFGIHGVPSEFQGNEKMSKIIDALKDKIYYEENVDYEDYNISRTIKSIYPEAKVKKAPKLVQLHQYLGQSVWNGVIKEIEVLPLSQKESLKKFVDNIIEFSTVERGLDHKDNPKEALDTLKAETHLQEKILKMKDLVSILSLQEYLSTKLVVSTASHELTDTLQSQENK